MATHGTNIRARSAGDKRIVHGPDTAMERELAADRDSGADRIVRLPTPAKPSLVQRPRHVGRKATTCR